MIGTERHVGKYKLEAGKKELLSAAKTYFWGTGSGGTQEAEVGGSL